MVIKAVLPLILALILVLAAPAVPAGRPTDPPKRLRELGVVIGVLKPGAKNSLTDVSGVRVGQVSMIQGTEVRTGVTAILPHGGNLFRERVPAGIYVGNGFGKLMGLSQVEELGQIETPIVLTNTLSVPVAADAVLDYMLGLPGDEDVQSVNPVVGETNDSLLNDIRGRHITKEHVLQAIRSADTGAVAQGAVGAGTGTVCFGFKGGIGSASRLLPKRLGGYTVGVLVQTNFGGVLQIAGVPVGQELGKYYLKDELEKPAGGSCMIVVATDAPLTSRNLTRLAKRAMLGLARTGGIAANGSGDYVIAFSTAPEVRPTVRPDSSLAEIKELTNEAMTPLFLAVIEATEEAVLDSLFTASSMTGRGGVTVEALPVARVMEILKRYNRVH